MGLTGRGFKLKLKSLWLTLFLPFGFELKGVRSCVVSIVCHFSTFHTLLLTVISQSYWEYMGYTIII
jgi:hypothetical protein